MNLEILNYQNYFFVGIAGTGMSALAQYLNGIGKNVSGSDRQFNSYDQIQIRDQFKQLGIACYPQDASGINSDIDVVIISTAIEKNNIEYQKAKELKIPIIKRSEILSAISKTKRTIAVAGTSGKSTTAAMIFHILQNNDYHPSLITGAGLISLQEKGLPGNAWVGKSDWLVIEADESDGSIVHYYPEISVLLNIDRDHKEYEELKILFETFKNQTSGKFIVNSDHALSNTLSQNIEYDFGIKKNIGINGSDFKQRGFSITFKINNIEFNIPVIGKHNMENALAAVAVCSAIGLNIEKSAKILQNYNGIYRRTQLIGEINGIHVIDDFAHNPSEVSAAIRSCQQIGKRIIAWFQPHGFGPLRFFHKELSKELIQTLRQEDIFYISDVYYAGGTVTKDISSDIVTEAINKCGKKAEFIPDKNKLPKIIKNISKKGDVILLMGARDPSLSKFAQTIYQNLISD
ncbi:UDP-N-acetylmuramate--L-alanine ligase [Bacteroidota bacterium]